MATRRGGKKKGTMSAERYFGSVAPRLVVAMREKLAELGGTYAVTVEGEGGGSWTLDFDRGEVRPGAEPATLSLTLTTDQFASLARPDTELRKLVSEGRVPSTGDTERVENLSLLLAFLGAG